MSIMFFTDLDRTIIYSKGFVTECASELVEVERNSERVISWMTKSAATSLRELREKVALVPVTARKYDEIMRIDFIRNNIPAVMICESGAAIYINGVRDIEWDSIVDKKVSSMGENRDIAHEEFRALIEGYNEVVRVTNKHMLMSKFEIDENYDREQLAELEDIYAMLGFNFELQAPRKIYLTPFCISKGNAVKYIKEKYGPAITLGAGDAPMDHCIFEHVDYHIVPKGHTMLETIDKVTLSNGLLAGQEIIEYVLSVVSRME